MIEQNEKNTEKINKYKELSPEDYNLLEYDIEDLVQKLPKICKDLNLLWDLLLHTYGKECFTPMIIKKFPNQFNVDGEKITT